MLEVKYQKKQNITIFPASDVSTLNFFLDGNMM